MDGDNQELNRELIEAFVASAAGQFPHSAGMSGGLNVCKTDGIDGMPVPHGYTASVYDSEHGIGMTVIVWGSQRFKAFVEIVSNPSDGKERAEVAGRVFGRTLSIFQVTAPPRER